MIRRDEATILRLSCDACSNVERAYQHGANRPFGHFDVPDGWVVYPDYIAEDAEPRAVLCPTHADLISTLRLMDSMAARVAQGLTS